MKYREFKGKIEDWGRKYNYKPIVEVDLNCICMVIEYEGGDDIIFTIDKSKRFILDLNWDSYRNLSDVARRDLFEIATEFAATPIEEREDEKRFIIPLPELITTDGREQYLTYENGNFFASRRDEDLKQLWNEDELKYFIPEFYRQFAVEKEDFIDKRNKLFLEGKI